MTLELTTKAEVELAAFITDTVVQTDRADRRRNAEADTAGIVDLIIAVIPRNVFYAAPGITHVGKDDALDFLAIG